MDKPQKKYGSPILVFTVAFVAILVITIIINRKSKIFTEISLPLNNGIINLSTCGNLLAAVSNDNRLYILDWAELSKRPREYAIESEQSALITPDTVVSVRRITPDCIVVSGLDGNEKRIKISLPFGYESGLMGVNRHRDRIFVLLVHGGSQSSVGMKYKLFEVLINSEKVRPVIELDFEQSKPVAMSVSDDARHIVVAGEKNNQGWMFVVDTKEDRLVWRKEMPDMKKIYHAVFSCDGKVIYARGTDSTLLLFDTDSGDVIDRLLPVKENKSTYGVQAIQTVAASSDGKLVAATILGNIFVWDTQTKKILFDMGAGHKVISSITFSGDSRFLATSDMRQGGKINILRMPRTHN
jgi:WD40 repeat protein